MCIRDRIFTRVAPTARRLASHDPRLLTELGKVLAAVSAGQPAGKVFRQNERTKPKKRNREAITIVYWYMRACSADISDDAAALAQVKACLLYTSRCV